MCCYGPCDSFAMQNKKFHIKRQCLYGQWSTEHRQAHMLLFFRLCASTHLKSQLQIEQVFLIINRAVSKV